MDLIEKLKELQGTKSQQEFATEIGIDQSILSRLYSGEITLGVKTARMLRKRFPELSLEIAAFLLAENMHTNHSAVA